MMPIMSERNDTLQRLPAWDTNPIVTILDASLDNFTNSSISEEELLLARLGPRRKDLTSVIFLLVIYLLIFVSGTFGNICTCIVIIRNHYMQTTTNYFLFSLAVSDVLILIFGLPQEAYTIWEAYPWRFGKEFCIFKAMLSEVTSYASVLTITAFTVERYVAICHPLKSHKLTDLGLTIKIIIGIWIFSLLCAIPYPIHTRIFYYVNYPETNTPIPDSLSCNIPPQWQARMGIMFQVSSFLFFIIPMTLITVLYILIAVTLRRTTLNRAGSEDSTRGNGTSSHSIKVVLRMLVAVVVAFFACWAPYHAQRLMTLYNTNWTKLLLEVQSNLFFISGILYFVGSTVNPILYNVMSKRYRQAFKETICCCIWKKSLSHQRTFMSYTGYYKGPVASHFRKTSPDWRGSGYEDSIVENGRPRLSSMAPPAYDEQVKLLQDKKIDPVSNGHTSGLSKNGNKVTEHCPTCSGNMNSIKMNQNTMVRSGEPGHQTELLDMNRKKLYPTAELKKVQRMGTCV